MLIALVTEGFKIYLSNPPSPLYFFASVLVNILVTAVFILVYRWKIMGWNVNGS